MRAFPAARRRLVQHWLITAQPVFEGRVPLEVVRRERREVWAAAPPAERRALLAAVLPALEEPTAATVDTAEPLRWLLEQIGDGVTLTQAGYRPRELVAAAFARYPRWYPIGKGRAPRRTCSSWPACTNSPAPTDWWPSAIACSSSRLPAVLG
ncbi:hypothetical protein ACIQRW_26605 [Streptomyces sp. NPDC091287]|uniref:hypothetical protein n=1 Tax=Streptomyces sp. NPDC091287 TaxID=3365988 RepID=UPI00382617F9